ncbi:MAG: peptidase S8 and S53, subtilisin, kexin, sedolisin, partial [uncultured bacterium]
MIKFCLILAIFLTTPFAVFARVPNDEYFSELWHLQKIKAVEAWNISIGSKEVIVAVLDSGIDLDHPDLKDNLWKNEKESPFDNIDNDKNGYADDFQGWDFVSDDNDPSPTEEGASNTDALIHGTVIAGIIGSKGGNSIGVVGVNWDVKLMPVRVIDSAGTGQSDKVAKGIRYAVSNGADVINLSFTGTVDNQDLSQAVEYAYKAGVVVVAAVGNDPDGGVDMSKSPIYPACSKGANGEDTVIGVSASDENDDKANFSNYGASCTDIAAPGTNIVSTLLFNPSDIRFEDAYGGYWSGTSVAAPIVSGAAALLRSVYPNLSVDSIRSILKLSVDPLNMSDSVLRAQMGSGRLNIANAFEIAKQFATDVASSQQVSPQVMNSESAGVIVAGSAAGSAPRVAVMDYSGTVSKNWFAYAEAFLGGVNVAIGDVDADGAPEIITGAGAGGGPHVRVFSLDGTLESQFFAYDQTNRSGIFVSVADANSDGRADIIVSQGSGGSSEVRVFDSRGTLFASVSPFGTDQRGAIRASAGDLNNDGKAEIVASRSRGYSPVVRVLDLSGKLILEFNAYAPLFLGGVNVSVSDIDADGKDEIVTGTGAGGGPHV